MPIDFKYVPTSGDLSGTSFEQQTERAFNELGAEIDSVKETTDIALAVAHSAQSAATSAVNTADAAANTAQAATQIAQTAIQNANGATLIAQNASEQSQSAYDLASSAKTQAESAENSAQASIGIAQNAENTAESAEENVTAISVIAKNAQSTAETALALAKGIYKTTDARIDADEEVQAKMLYITNPDSLNFPAATPVFFSVCPTDDGTQALQFCYVSDDNPGFCRTSVSLNTDPALNVWEKWITSNITNNPAKTDALGVGCIATQAEAQSGSTDPSREDTPAFLTPETGVGAIKANLPLSLTAPRVYEAQNFNTYTTAGRWAFEAGAHSNGPGLSSGGSAGGILTVKRDNLPGAPVRLTQSYEVWGPHSAKQAGVTYTRGFHGDSGVWSGWQSNSWQPDVSALFSVASPYTMPYNGFILTSINADVNCPVSAVYIDGVAVHVLSYNAPSYTVSVRMIVPAHKGSVVSCTGSISLFQIMPSYGRS